MNAQVEVRPTEDIDKVKTALAKVVTGNVQTQSTGNDYYMLSIDSDERSSLDRLKMILQRERIRTAARAVMIRNTIDEDRMEFYLNKQVAYAGHVSFCESEGESPLGPIRIVVASSDLPSLINWLTGGK